MHADHQSVKAQTEPSEVVNELTALLKADVLDADRIRALFEAYYAFDTVPTDSPIPAQALTAAAEAVRRGVPGFSMLRFQLESLRLTRNEIPDDVFNYPTPDDVSRAAFLYAAEEAAQASAVRLPEPFDEETRHYVANVILSLFDREPCDDADKDRLEDLRPFIEYRLGRTEAALKDAGNRLLCRETAELWFLRASFFPTGTEDRINALGAAADLACGKDKAELCRSLMTELIAAGSTETEARALPASADFLASCRSKAKECLVAELPEMRAVFGMFRIDERYGRPPAERLRVPIAVEEPHRIWAAEVVLKEKAKVGRPGVPVHVKGAREADGTFRVLTLRPRPEGKPWDLLRTRRGTVMEISGYGGEAVCVGDCDREFSVSTILFPPGSALHVGDTVECRGAQPGTDREFVTFVARVLPGETGPSVRRVSGRLSDNPRADLPGEERYELRTRQGLRVEVSSAMADEANAAVGNRVTGEAVYWRRRLRMLRIIEVLA